MNPLRWTRVAAILVIVSVAWLFADGVLRYELNQIFPTMQPVSSYRDKPGLPGKIDYYRQHAREYDLIFVGDSRTYCGLAPDLLDPRLRTHSINLSGFGNWFPTQYSSLQEILSYAPPGTIVVWSIGHQNFRQVKEAVNLVYPIGLRNVPTFLRWGFSWPEIQDNVLTSVPGLELFVWRHQLRERVEQLVQRQLSPAPVHAESTSSLRGGLNPAVQEVINGYRNDPQVAWVDPIYDRGSITSLGLYKRGGNYVRVELVPEFFRDKQRELAAAEKPIAGGRFSADPEYWNTFLGIVELFSHYDVRLIVNEFEEAPYHYDIPENRQAYRTFMKEIAGFFRDRGIPYIRADFDQLHNDDYFDYNHLNSVGIPKYTDLLIRELKPLIPARRFADGIQ